MDPRVAVPAAPPRAVLAFGTSTEWCSVGLQYRADGGLLRSDVLSERAGQEHSRRALAMAGELLRSARISLAGLDAIAFDAGPGSFTGLRIGCGIAQGLGFALDRPLVPVASLEALAHRADEGIALVAIDARMGEVYCAAYRVDAARAQPLGALRVLAPQAAARVLLEAVPPGGRAVALGDACLRYEPLAAAMRERGIPVRAACFAPADAIAAIGWRRLAAGEAVPAAQAAPLYVREKVALDVDEQRSLREARAGAA